MKEDNVLQVYYEEKRVGILALTADHKAAFQYDEKWLENGFSISPFSLPLKKQVFLPTKDYFSGLFGVFADSLPDNWGRLLLDRLIRAHKQAPDELTVLDRLAIVGKSGMGALTYYPEKSFSEQTGNLDLDELAEEEIKTGAMIVYTSSDSVLQICGNEETFGLDELYRCCKIARELTMKPEWKVGRVIARPYVGKKKGEFKRTANRHDYALKPYGKTAMDALKEAGFDVISIGKIRDIFDGEGITQAIRSKSSVQGMEQTIECLDQDFTGLCFTNLVDFDALWGHRRNPQGYAEELEKFDVLLGQFLEKMKEDDLVIVTADHGNDPTFKGTDHTKERVPFLAYSPSMKTSGRIDDQNCFAVIGATIADNFGVAMPEGTIGTSILEQLD